MSWWQYHKWPLGKIGNEWKLAHCIFHFSSDHTNSVGTVQSSYVNPNRFNCSINELHPWNYKLKITHFTSYLRLTWKLDLESTPRLSPFGFTYEQGHHWLLFLGVPTTVDTFSLKTNCFRSSFLKRFTAADFGKGVDSQWLATQLQCLIYTPISHTIIIWSTFWVIQ